MSQAQILAPETSMAIGTIVSAMPPQERLQDVHHRLADIQSDQLRKLLDRQDEIIGRIDGLASLTDLADAERQKAILETDLSRVREEIAKRTENVSVMAAELFALYDELGLQAQTANADSPEDAIKRQTAQNALQNAMTELATAEANLKTAQEGVTTAEGHWNLFTRTDKVAKAEEVVTAAEAAVETAKADVEAAKNGIGEAEAQIEIDKAHRIRNASLSENFGLIRQFTENAVKTLEGNVTETEGRRVITDKALASALAKKTQTARSLDATRDDIERLERDHARENTALGEIADHGSAAYSEQQEVVAGIEKNLVVKRGEELKLNTELMALSAAVEANKSSLAGLTSQRDTAEVFIIKLKTAEKTAMVLGHNIDRMVKNATQEAASDALDRVSDRMILTTVELGIHAEVASSKLRNAAIARHDDLMQQLNTVRGAGDQAMATEAARYIQLDQTIRAGYQARGVDLDMGHLQAAAEAVKPVERPKPVANTEEVEY